MAVVHPIADLRVSRTASLFEGHRHAGADVNVSCFVVATPPGGGPVLHTHPYPEVFVVQEGEATFTAGDEEVEVTGGYVVVVPAETPHRFVNTGEDTLRLVGIHANGKLVQRDLE
jgi:mannose-6-phosphate isomerase-like protein (cupin superfamily)